MYKFDLYFEMGPPMSENPVKESQSHVASHNPPRQGMGRYRGTYLNLSERLWTKDPIFLFLEKT